MKVALKHNELIHPIHNPSPKTIELRQTLLPGNKIEYYHKYTFADGRVEEETVVQERL